MFRYALFFWFAAAFAPTTPYASPQDVSEVLSRSEALYYEAKFNESLQLLTALDGTLQSNPGHIQEKVRIKLQLALGYLALNDVDKAKSNFAEMCALDSECSLDAHKYPPKVLSLFEEAKAEYSIERPYREGVEAFKRDDVAEAVRKFRDVLKQDPENTIAAQYLTVADEKLRLAVDQKLQAWRKDFIAGDLKLAAADYRQLVPLNLEGIADSALDQIRKEYRKAMAPSIEGWNRACDSGDITAMNQIRAYAVEMLPDAAIGQDLLDQMATCTSKACIPQTAETVMLHVKSSREPEIPFAMEKILQKPSTRTVQVEARIEKDGDVTVLFVRGQNKTINDAVRSAVSKWKFLPAILENEARCVQTVFPIVITRFAPN